jgi:hypothetical protein
MITIYLLQPHAGADTISFSPSRQIHLPPATDLILSKIKIMFFCFIHIFYTTFQNNTETRLKNQLTPTEKPLLRDQKIIYAIIDGFLKIFRGG